ncbi:MAG TPA: alpha-amylase family glycosyl hydrolase [Polyangiaceae bacterium]|jgi:glycosidase
MRSQILLFALTVASCADIGGTGQKAQLATHVDDWRDEVIYQVIVDRFADGDINNDYTVSPGFLGKYQGGDWKGIEDHLGYLQDLGVTTLWISPIVKNVDSDADIDAYHGYWQEDLHKLDAHFGDAASLRSLVNDAHARGMKVVLDIVCNHMGQLFFYDINKNGKPDEDIAGNGTSSTVTHINEYDPDWDPTGVQSFSSAGPAGRAPIIFINDPSVNRTPPPDLMGTPGAYHGFGRILNYNDPAQVTLGDFPGGLKDVATELPEVRAYMIDAFSNWVEQFDFDGFRIDTVKHVEHEFWQTFTAGVRARIGAEGKHNFIMFGEAFDGNDSLVGSYTVPGELDSMFYFPQHYQVFHDVFSQAHVPNGQASTAQIEALWTARKTNYGSEPQNDGIGVAPQKALVNFLDNHDVPRFLYDAAGDVAALRNALTFLLTEDGIPCIYYGTEQEFDGGNDPSNREVLWTKNFDETGATFQHVALVAKIRKAYVALRRGDTKVVYSTPHVAQETDAGIFAFERTGGDAGSAYALVVLDTNANKSSSTGDVNAMAVSAAPGTVLVDVLDPAQTQYTVAADGTLRMQVPAQSASILVPQDQVVPIQ